MTVQRVFKLICYSEEIVDGEPIYVSSNSLPFKANKLEPAGHAFHALALKLSGFAEKKDQNKAGDDQNVPSSKEQNDMPSFDSYSTKKTKKKAGAKESEEDHYALLNLGHLRYLATEEQIRKSYRDTALRYHPDKQAALLLSEKTEAAKQTKKSKIENHFKSIQEAYEILMDPAKRRIYDSTDEFDDKIPSDCAPQDFFKVFSPAFVRNGRWSVNQPIPSLGDENTTLNEVDNFYSFWYSFKSWREFPHEDEHDLEQAESRDHKRWMERQNAKLSEKAKKEDYSRIRTLVDNSYKRDPRILKRKEEEKAEKKKKRGAKYQVQKLQEEEAARIAEEERRKKEEDDKRAAETAAQQKKLREKEKKLLRKERSRLRTISASVLSQKLLDLTKDDVENLCMSLEYENLKTLCDKIEGKEGLVQAKHLKSACGLELDVKFDDEKQAEEKPLSNGTMGQNEPMTQNGKRVQNGSMAQNGLASSKSTTSNNSNNNLAATTKGDYSSLKTFPKEVSKRCDLVSAAVSCKSTEV